MTKMLLIPVDGSDSAARALAFAVELQQQNASLELCLVNAQQPTLYSSLIEGLGHTLSMQKMLLEQGEAIISYHAQTLQKQGITFSPNVMIGKPQDVICELAKKYGVCRIVMGKHGSHQSSYIFGSVAYPVVQSSPVPVTLIQ